MNAALTTLLLTTFSHAYLIPRAGPSCPLDTPLSCSSADTPSGVDTCCFQSPSGALVLTQFWNYDPAGGPGGDDWLGPADEFTIHGLWPDLCNGDYQVECDKTLFLQTTVQDVIVNQFGDQDLFSAMTRSWKGIKGDESLWKNEYDRHGTCVNTIHPDCYSNPKANQNIYDYFRIAVALAKKLPTYQFLTAEGIAPSTTQTYTKSQIQAALTKHFGHEVYFKCDTTNAISEVWYFHYLKGSLLGENFIPIDSLEQSACPDTGIKFLPKELNGGSSSSGSTSTPTPTSTTGSQPTGGTKGYIRAGSNSGCVISGGQYYEDGTCATFTFAAAASGGQTIKSSKGFCIVDANNYLSCASGNAAEEFTRGDGGSIVSDGVENWCFGDASGSPPKTTIVRASGSACDGKETFKLTA